MYLVQWDDHTGQRHERRFKNLNDAILEKLALEDSDDVEYVYQVEKVSGKK